MINTVYTLTEYRFNSLNNDHFKDPIVFISFATIGINYAVIPRYNEYFNWQHIQDEQNSEALF